jgi:3-oxoacyl-[acyl-carrier protein] reductase
MDVNLQGKVCIVTGGGRGLGKAVTELFAASGAKMVWALDLSFEEFGDLAQKSNISVLNVDVGQSEEVEMAVAHIQEVSGAFDVLVNNAGITRDALIQNMSLDQWRQVMQVNLDGVFYMTKAAAPIMLEQRSGVIINMASVVALDGNIGQSNYAATKGAVVSMTRTWAKELSRKGEKIRVNALAPGFIRTPMTEKMPEKILTAMVEKTPLKRMGEAGDIARAALFLASDKADFITGQVLRVDGGLVF